MKLQKILLLKLIVVILTLFIFHPGFSQIKSDKAISFSGTIDSVPKDPKFIIVNERRVYLSSNTKIASGKGSILRKDDLKRGLSVSIEGVEKPEGIFAGKITVLSIPRTKP
jgi:hypothetical protein